MVHTKDDLRLLQALPLPVKVRMTEQRIKQWVNEYGIDGVYVSFSGGKDSTVLLDIARNIFPDVKAVFINTGLEYPEIVQFVKTFDDVDIIRPKMSFKQVIEKYGYPFISKEKAHLIFYAKRLGVQSKTYKKLIGVDEYKGSLFASPKYGQLINADYIIGERCCSVMKKSPAHIYGHLTNRKAITAQMAADSVNRETLWKRYGCNMFNANNPISNPMAFWTEQDVLRYIKERNLPIASVYGDVVVADADGFEYDGMICGECQYNTTGCNRTGCIFCGFGAHLEKGETRFERLKRTHPKLYSYCLGGGGYDPEGIWKPTNEGLGMAHVIDDLNRRYGKDFIKY